jgi:U32 family peptidase
MAIVEPSSLHPRMELLAPAGTLPAFEVALIEGADAVYVGAPGLNARALARDFTLGEIAAMTGYAHDRGKKVYVAMNSLVKEDEIRLAVETLLQLVRIEPDALIIQDPGMLYLVRRFFPQLKVHASTLMTVNNSLTADYFKDLGFERVVLARELSLKEIRTIHQRSSVALEIFIHGAMCFSYSGLCRFSSLHGGKSSLRGQCVQPCRRRYDWLPSGKRSAGSHGGKDGGHLFSMNDLSGIDYLAEAREAGVVSLKIEGRLKSVEYVRNTVRAYRLALDALDAPAGKRAGMLAEAHRYLDAAMGRKRSSGFFVAGKEDRLIVPRLSGSIGEVVGKVVRLEEIRGPQPVRGVAMQVTLQTAVKLGDRLRLYEERTGDRTSFSLRSLEIKGKKVDQASAGQMVTITTTDIQPGSLRQPFQGVLFRVDISGRTGQKCSPELRNAAQRQPPPVDPSTVKRLLTTLAIMDTDDKPDARPQTPGRRQPGRKNPVRERAVSLEWWLKVQSLEALAQRYPFKITKVLLDLNSRNVEYFLKVRQRNKPGFPSLVWALPPVIGEEQLPWYRAAVQQLRLQGVEHFQISHIGQIALFAVAGQMAAGANLSLYGDYTCNALNSAALRMYAECGLSGVQFSLETDRATLAAALAHHTGPTPPQGARKMKVGLYVYGRPPLFSARLDAPHFQGQRTFVSPRGERYYLDRREGTLYAFSHTIFSLLQYADELTQIGLDYLVVDVSHGQSKKGSGEVTALLSGRGDVPPVFSGNYNGILL